MDMDSLLALDAPAFTTSVAECSSSTSSLYITGSQEFCSTELTARREELRSAPSRMVDAVPHHGIASSISMLGGSSLREGGMPHPQEMDGLPFHEMLTHERPVTLSDLKRQLRELSDLDLRLIPLDFLAIDVIKLGAYFKTLFNAGKDGASAPNAVVPLDLGR
ncbi:hypothetical protein ABE424_18010 [Stenotrophomonas sp. TWI1149]|uniref:hypothetical protein n=1 Tax=unclassified Stenotrophomonas TaxID=196198 RepID=UPI00320901AB